MILGFDIGPQELLVVLIFFGLGGVVPVWGIIDAAVRPEHQWREANQSKVVWVLVQVFLGFIGAVVYFAPIRPKLKRVSLDPQGSSR